MNNIRNFSIIAHIDHGKSTLADRMLEITGTIEKRKMRAQVLDSMELERERGITIKMQPVRMLYKYQGESLRIDTQGLPLVKSEYILNLIDTPGHIDFSYEVSRAIKAVEGSLLLVDATQGVQAQTLTVLQMAQEEGLTIIPVITKIDSSLARIEEVKGEIIKLLNCNPEEIVEVSGKTGEGVEKLLQTIVEKIPPPKNEFIDQNIFRSLVFDFKYSSHRGIVVFVRVLNGAVRKGERLLFKVVNKTFTANEVGYFTPEEKECPELSSGEIGYIITGIKEAGIATVGETVSSTDDSNKALAGYMSPKPLVWASIYPESQSDFDLLKQSLLRLRLTDASFTFEEEASGVLGRGFRSGFLGMLHLEIIVERLKREFNLNLVITNPSINYEVELKNGKRIKVYSPVNFPDESEVKEIFEPWVKVSIILPPNCIGEVNKLLYEHEALIGETSNFSESRSIMVAQMPLRELMRNFFDLLKSVSSGYASISYELIGSKKANVVRLDVLVADDLVPAFSRVVGGVSLENEAKRAVEKLYNILPRQQFATKIQVKALGRIMSSRILSALRKDVTGYLYGGDITRKKKLWEKQKRGKARLKERGKVNIPHDVFLKMIQPE